MKVQVSVVIPTYRRPELLLRCLSALAVQRFDRNAYEVIVVSDGPDAVTEKALISYRKKNKFVQIRNMAMSQKRGPAAARNHGWAKAKGELIIFTDDDCIPDKNWLIAFYREYLLDKTNAFTGKTIVPISGHPTDYERNIAGLETADFITANCACPKKVLKAIDGFDEEFTMAWREDSELEFKLIDAGLRITKVNEAIVTHPVRQADWGISLKEQKKTMYNALLYKKYPALYRQKIQPSPPFYYYTTITFFILMLAGLFIKVSIVFIGGLLLWLGLTLLFAYRRLKFTSRQPNHLMEMVATSMLIPFFSIYWQFYGALKYRVLFI
jgi:glycosyltransferase involved in cell wall biosynthesis